jgi:F0F1-type ATP synthase membrane subunit b/b'
MEDSIMESKDTRTSSRQSASTAGQSGPSRAREGAEDVKAQAKQGAERMAEETRRQTNETVDNQKRAAAEQAGGLAGALRKTGDELNRQQQPYMAHYANRFASSLDRMAGTLRDQDADSLIGQAQDFARRQPGVFLGGAVAAGFALSRFLKSSDDRRHTGSRPSSSTSASARSGTGHAGEAPSPSHDDGSSGIYPPGHAPDYSVQHGGMHASGEAASTPRESEWSRTFDRIVEETSAEAPLSGQEVEQHGK